MLFRSKAAKVGSVNPHFMDHVAVMPKNPFTAKGRLTKHIMTSGNEDYFLHELGHAQALMKKGSMNRNDVASAVRASRSAVRAKKPINQFRNFAPHIAFKNLGRETEANVNALKTLRKRGAGVKRMGKFVANIAPGQATYLGIAAAYGLTAGAAGIATYKAVKKWRSTKKPTPQE